MSRPDPILPPSPMSSVTPADLEQRIPLENFMSGLTILLDRPFGVGDRPYISAPDRDP